MSHGPFLPLLNGPISLQEALAEDDNILVRLRYPERKKQFWHFLQTHAAAIEAAVRAHLGVKWCRLCPPKTWRAGSFNVAMPVLLLRHDAKRAAAYIRFPLPYKIGEDVEPGNAEEKLRAEIATYIWLEENCPDVPIPKLFAFGVPDGRVYTHPSETPFLERTLWQLWRWLLRISGRPVPSAYVPRRGRGHSLGAGFLMLAVAEGRQLSQTWTAHRGDARFRANLFRGLARVTASMNEHPLPRIGSLSFGGDGVVRLANRPLSAALQMYENEGVRSGVPRDRTYGCTEAYVSDMLGLHDRKMLHQLNAVHDRRDGESQLAALAALRAVMHRFVGASLSSSSERYSSAWDREGPFYLTLSDLHQDNIFVDEAWNVQCIIDLEWAHTKPLPMQLPPYWLTSRSVDEMVDAGALREYAGVLGEYLGACAEEERRRRDSRDSRDNRDKVSAAAVQRRVWESRAFWYFQAVMQPKGMYNIFVHHVQPLFHPEHGDDEVFDEVFFHYWGMGARETITTKLQEKKEYRRRIREAFGRGDEVDEDEDDKEEKKDEDEKRETNGLTTCTNTTTG